MKFCLLFVFCEISVVIALNVYHCKNQAQTNYGEHDLYSDGMRLSGKTSIKFQVKGSSDAHVLLQHDNNNQHTNVIEIVIGGWSNGKSVIRTQQQQDPAKTEHKESGIISSSNFRWFWISWAGRCIQVGKGESIGSRRFMNWCGLSFSVTAMRISFGFGSGGYFAFECNKVIDNCVRRHCTNARDTTCDECASNKVFYKVTQGGKKCGRMCSFDNHKCWPGTCPDELTTSCKCAPGFTRVSNSTVTACQLTKTNRPTINQCFTTVSGPNKEKVQTAPGTCNATQDMYGNFQPVKLDLELQSDFSVNVTMPKLTFIHTSTFGVTDITVYMKRMLMNGTEIDAGRTEILKDVLNGTKARQTVSNKTQIPIPQSKYRLADGERLCIHFETLGGGFVEGKDTRTNKPLASIPYQKTRSTETVCYIYDSAKPQHCLENMSCHKTPLVVDNRVTRSKRVVINFDGWFDPVPTSGSQSSSSGLDFFELSMHEVSGGRVSKDAVNTTKLNVSQTSFSLNISSDSPRLYCIKLGVKDVANNVKFARRFVLYDNTSVIKTRVNKTMFYVSSASEISQHLWQTHHDKLCMIWKDYFYNDFYFDNPFLDGVQPDSDTSGIYEQTVGLLPINGTSNVYGIINFMFSWKLNNGTFSNETIVPSFTQQRLCTRIDMKDGQTYTLNIKAKDIVNNSYAEERTVYIDRSVPLINNIWITKDGLEQIFVHDNNDLSKMKLSFETFDTHSGIRSIEWTFGTENSGHLLGKGTIRVNRMNKDTCPNNDTDCYCPDIGSCENRKYTVDLNKLVNNNTNIGDHNRNYFLTLTVFNHARLRNIEHLDILVDVSPPESGVVLEGAIGSPDIDYTNENNFIVRWHGFIDHESGIKMYRIGVSDKCLKRDDFIMQNDLSSTVQFFDVEHPATSIRVQGNFTGNMYVTVIAINNAMQSSIPSCSDGITLDIDAPRLRNITLQNARWSSSIFCFKGQAWFLNNEMTKIPLSSDKSCKERCSNNTGDSEIFEILPLLNSSNKETEIGEFLCESLPLYDSTTIMYLPNDHIYIKWDVEEDESQIEDFFVGIGRSSDKSSDPTVQKYQSTNGNPYYHVNHLGFGSNEEFYIFVKVINKAKLDNVISFGPLLIDETPPLYKKVPVISIQDETVTISWHDGQFYDTEQTEKIDQIFFQFVRGTRAVSPLLEWRNTVQGQCQNESGGCIEYPLKRLQQKDTEVGVNFSVDVFIYNKAGHFTKLRTRPFKIPSKYPPGHGIILDIDPSQTSSSLDINAHFEEKKICARWKGFRHHENVSFDIGVGTNKTNGDVYKFKPVNKMKAFACLTSEKFRYGVRYFVLIRASCTGGTTFSSSDGVLIFESQTLLEKSDIQVGMKRENILLNTESINSSYTRLCFKSQGRIGTVYEVSVEINSRNIKLQSNDAHVNASTKIVEGLQARTYYITPFVEQPCFILTGSGVDQANVSITKELPQGYVTTKNVLFVTLKKNTNNSYMLPHWALFENSCTNKHNTNSSCMHLLVNYQSENADFYYNFRNIKLNETKTYSVGVQLCTVISCSEFTFSEPFVLEHAITSASITQYEIHENHDNITVNISWKQFEAKSGIALYQWTLSKDDDANQVIGSWKTMINKGQTRLLVTESVHLPVHPHSTLYLCIRAFSNAATVKTVCKRGIVISKGIQDMYAVYDLDASFSTWNKILDMVHSSSLGDDEIILHDSELDFGTRKTEVAGAVLYATQRNVTWYLMASKRIPIFGECPRDKDCITSRSNSEGYILFNNENLISNKLYFTCAFSEETEIRRETYTETVAEISSCSDGFILDNVAPSGGKIHVQNTAGFLSDLNDVNIAWERFSDNIDANILGYDENIKFYSYAIGSSPTSTDIRNFTNVGLSRRVTEMIDVRDGTTVFVFVKGTDQAGLSSVVHSEELLVDTSSPTTGHLIMNNKHGFQSFVTSSDIDLFFTEFFDAESGIDHFEICLESHPKTCDISNMTSFYEDHIHFRLPKELHDGNIYSLSGWAINRAGLKSDVFTSRFIKDVSPPSGGNILDGHWSLQNDKDYQTEIDVIAGHWSGFSDPHSGMQYYRVGLGSHPQKSDIEPMVDVGLQTEACNGAGLCTSRASDGILLDNSPPINGLVKIGPESSHLKYISQRTSLHIQWTGFEDPHSEIEHYEYCVGTHRYSCDMCPLSSCLLQSNVIKTNTSFPRGIDLFVMVVAYNWAGLSVKQTSDSFQVDDSAPKMMQRPHFVLENNTYLGKNVFWEKSLLRITWKFIDLESPIVKHIISLKTHHEGHTPVENIVIGNTDTYMINLDKNNWLHDGDSYFVVVESCNIAGLCSSAQSKTVLIDSSPPLMGGFMPPMDWVNFLDSRNNSKANVSLRWYGFVDPESAINTFYITVSRSYSGNELTEGCAVIKAQETAEKQTTVVTLNDSVTAGEAIILTIWAQNAAELNSSASRVTVWPLSYTNENMKSQSGTLELEKHSCDSHFCSGECTCSVIGKSCKISGCNYINSTDVKTKHLPRVYVYSGLGSVTQNMTASSACLSGHWETVGGDDSSILRYEWSIGLSGEKAGTGIFDPSEKQWRDVGKRTQLVYCLPLKSGLIHDMQYTTYIKAWYSKSDYAVFTSTAIAVDHTPPQKAKGMVILDSDHSCTVDYDIIDWMDEMTFCWKGVFRETQSTISHYSVALGTSVNGSDVFQTTDVGLATNITLTKMNFSHGTRYFFTVVAFNTLGMHNIFSSDGFVVDMDTPVSGVVFNTENFINKGFQSLTSTFGISWHGFLDNFSGVKSYHVAMCEENVNDTSTLTFTNVGLKTRHIFTNVRLQHGRMYIGLVKAFDAAGHSSIISRSPLKRIDVTPPHGLECDKYILQQWNETSAEFSQQLNESSYHSRRFETYLRKDNLYKLTGIVNGNNPMLKVMFGIDRFEMVLPTARNHNGSQEFEYRFISPMSKTSIIRITQVFVTGERQSLNADLYECVHTLPTFDADDYVRVQQIGPSTLAVSAMIFDPESAVHKLQFGLGATQGGLQIKPFLPIKYGTQSVIDVQAEHGSSVFMTVIAENHAGLSSTFTSNPVIIDKSPPSVSDLQVTLTDVSTTGAGFDIYATWKAEDLESGVKICYCGVGKGFHTKGLEELKPIKAIDSCEFKNLSFWHGDIIIVKVFCLNNVELSQERVSNPVVVSRRSPNIEHAKVNVVSAFRSKRCLTLYGQNITDCYIQSEISRVRVEWSGFWDSSDIDCYEYRLRNELGNVVEWTTSRKQTMVDMYGLSLTSGVLYALDVRAENSGHYVSEPVTVSLLIHSEEPKLTGKALSISQNNQSIAIDWTEVFEIPDFEDVAYDVTIGSRQGYSDVIQYQRVEFKHCLITVPDSTTISDKINEIFIAITCKFSSGRSAQYDMNYKM